MKPGARRQRLGGSLLLRAAAVAMALLVAGRAAPSLLPGSLEDGLGSGELVRLRQQLLGAHPTLGSLRAGAAEFWAIVGPGGKLHPGWFLEHKGHLVIEGLLAVIIAVMLLQSRFYPRATEDEDALTEAVRCWHGQPPDGTAVAAVACGSSLLACCRAVSLRRWPRTRHRSSSPLCLHTCSADKPACRAVLLLRLLPTKLLLHANVRICRRLTRCVTSGSRCRWRQTLQTRTCGQTRQ